MPPPSSVPSRLPAEPSVPNADIPQSYGQETAPLAGPFSSQSTPGELSGIPAPPAVRTTASRMPPMIGSSQHTNQRAARIVPPVHIQSTTRNVPAASPNAAHGSAHLEQGHSSQYNEFHQIPGHLPGLDGNLGGLSFSIDSSQIDPQLIADALGLSSLGSQGTSDNAISMAQMNADDVSFVDSSLPRPSPGRPPEAVSSDVDTPDDESANREPGSGSGPAKRKRSRKTGAAANQGGPEPTSKRRKTGPRSRTRPPSPPPFDPDADPGEELDPTVVTMAALCDDTGRGRVSSKAAQIVSNHAAWRAANREKRARMKAVMEAKKYGRNLEEEEETSTTPAKTAPEEDTAVTTGTPVVDPDLSREGNDDLADKDADDFDYSEPLAVSQYNVQVRIGANGETIIDEDSLFVNRDEEHRTEDYTHVEESDFTKFVNSATYSKKLRGSRWSAEETEMFYNALSQFGENYELISYVLPGRDRKACKNKFKTEDRKNPARITYCLNNRTPYDIATLSRMTGKDFSGPTPEIRAPTPVDSAELPAEEPPPSPPSPSSARVVRKKSKKPSVRDAGVEVLGSVDDFDKDEESGALDLDILSR
ncbi:hypothetical protein OH76DRAFT_1481711 [Lentinus brumalis]|uniref:Myb-like domain-containing protein n=1 Tax=Lentinus brumalis TaxID=2498619 RepID=A0A371DEP7_9APHY|nr:hypothetical protein OH76DRAFT_1481711 [Polyporus brumalis]